MPFVLILFIYGPTGLIYLLLFPYSYIYIYLLLFTNKDMKIKPHIRGKILV